MVKDHEMWLGGGRAEGECPIQAAESDWLCSQSPKQWLMKEKRSAPDTFSMRTPTDHPPKTTVSAPASLCPALFFS